MKCNLLKLQFLLTFFFILFNFKCIAQDNKLKVLVIVNGENDLKVDLNNEAFTAGGLLGVLISESINNNKEDEKSSKLKKLMSDFQEYKFKHVDFIKSNYQKFNESLDITAINRKDANKYFKENLKLDYDKLKQDNWKSVILIDEVLGFFREDLKNNKFYISLTSVVKAFDIENKKNLGKIILLNKNIKNLYGQDEILENKNILPENYTAIYPNVDQVAYYRLLGKDIFHTFSKSQKLESKFPSVKKKLKEYAKKFEVKFPSIEKWSSYPTLNDFAYVNAPRKDKMVMAISTTIDLAIDELGQKDMTLEEYSLNQMSNLKEANFEIDTKTEYPKLDVKQKHIAYMVTLPKGGKSIFIDQKIDEYFISNEIILAQNDYLTLLNKYKLDIEKFISETYLILKSESN